jgi:hypothetical protein
MNPPIRNPRIREVMSLVAVGLSVVLAVHFGLDWLRSASFLAALGTISWSLVTLWGLVQLVADRHARARHVRDPSKPSYDEREQLLRSSALAFGVGVLLAIAASYHIVKGAPWVGLVQLVLACVTGGTGISLFLKARRQPMGQPRDDPMDFPVGE